jgi:hypothetical protein
MNKSKITMVILAGLLVSALQGYAQPSAFVVKIKGACLLKNDSGQIVSQKLDNKSLIQEAVTATHATNSSDLTLVYVLGASADPATPGDFLEVVNSSTGVPVYTNLLFLYGSPFPPTIISDDQSRLAAGAQVVPLPLAGTGDALGGATIQARFLAKKTVISGSFNYTTLRSPGSTSNDIVKACSGSFSASKLFEPK